MDTALFVMVSLLVGAFALAFKMDWLGLWVSKEEMKEEIARSQDRRRHAEELSGRKAPVTGLAQPRREAAAPCSPVLPVNAREVPSMPSHARVGNQPSRQALEVERAQALDRWQGEGGQG